MYKKLILFLFVGVSINAMDEILFPSNATDKIKHLLQSPKSKVFSLLKNCCGSNKNNSQVVPIDIENPSINTPEVAQANEGLSRCFNPLKESEKKEQCLTAVGCVGTSGMLSFLCTCIVWYCVQQSVFG